MEEDMNMGGHDHDATTSDRLGMDMGSGVEGLSGDRADHQHPMNGMHDPAAETKSNEHSVLFSSIEGHLIDNASSVVRAVNSGNWSDPNTWEGGVVPGADAMVYIPNTVDVTYDLDSATRLDIVYVKGGLNFATDIDTTMVVDTVVTAYGSDFTIGTDMHPVGVSMDGTPILNAEGTQVSANIIIREDGEPADQRAWDPGQFSKGVVAHGTSSIVGANTEPHVALETEAHIGDTTLTLQDMPEGWGVGDVLVLNGTQIDRYGDSLDNTYFQDEELQITSITENPDGTATVEFINLDLLHDGDVTNDNQLRFDHVKPDTETVDPDSLNIYVANTSRNITVSSEAGEESLTQNGGDVHTRGHVMFMHNDNVIVRDAAFVDLGRTDKLFLKDNAAISDEGELISGGTNQEGRYGLHFHRTGAEDIEGTPAIADGVVVKGSPGWGLVHHQSFLNVSDSVVYEVMGAGMMAESGDEIGIWSNNIVIKTYGDQSDTTHDLFDVNSQGVNFWLPPGEGDQHRSAMFDLGFNGEALWLQGAAAIQLDGNIATSSNNGLVIFSENEDVFNKDAMSIKLGNLRTLVDHGDGTYSVESNEFVDSYLAQGYSLDDRIEVGAVPPTSIVGTEIINSELGLQTWYVVRNDDGVGEIVVLNPDGDNTTEGATSSVFGEITDTLMWGINSTGVFLKYTTNLEFNGLTIIGDPENPVEHIRASADPINGAEGNGYGIFNSGAPNGLRFTDVIIEGFERGLELQAEGFFDRIASEHGQGLVENIISNVLFASVDVPFITRSGMFEYTPSGNFTQIDGVTVLGHDDKVDPTAYFEYALNGVDESGAVGTVRLDATKSFANDASYESKLGGHGLIAYGWDLDNDGTIDTFGRFINAEMQVGVAQQVTLTVFDQFGHSDTSTQTITIENDRAFGNAIVNGDFEDHEAINDSLPSWGSFLSVYNAVNEGHWQTAEYSWDLSNGYAEFVGSFADDFGLTKIIFDEGEHIGEQTFSFDFQMNQNEVSAGDEIFHVALYAVKAGHFEVDDDGHIIAYQGHEIPEYVVLYENDFALENTLGWQSFSTTVTIPEGYKFIVPAFNVEGSVSSADDVYLDNVYLGDGARVITQDDQASAIKGQSVEIDVLANDYDANGDSFAVVSIDGVDLGGNRYDVGHGIVEILGNGNLAYTANNDTESGSYSFAYDVQESGSGLISKGNVQTYVDSISADDLILHFTFDEQSGYGVVDHAPYGKQYAGQAFWDTSYDSGNAVGGSAIHLDNDAMTAIDLIDDYGSYQAAAYIDVSNSHLNWEPKDFVGLHDQSFDTRTYSLWFNPDNTDGRQVILDIGNEYNGLSMYMLGDQLYVMGRQVDGSSISFSGSTGITAGEWHHASLAINGSTSADGQPAQTVTFYLDGQAIFSRSIIGSFNFSSDVSSAGHMTLGTSILGFLTHESGWLGWGDEHGFTGFIDEVRVYDRALSGSEVTTLHNDGLAAIAEVLAGPQDVVGTDDADILIDWDGADSLFGMAGDDELEGRIGDDTIDGGDGIDLVTFSTAETGVVVNLLDSEWSLRGHTLDSNTAQDGQGGIDTLISVEGAKGTEFVDLLKGSNFHETTFYGEGGDDVIIGGLLGDSLYGGSGADSIFGYAGNDLIHGGTGNDYLRGDSGHDMLYGGDGDDELLGGRHNDLLSGGDGQDLLSGGLGADTFVLEGESAFNDVDIVTDFDRGVSGDQIDISDVLSDYGFNAGTDVVSDWVAVRSDGTHSYLQVDRDGAAVAETMTDILQLSHHDDIDLNELMTNGNLIV